LARRCRADDSLDLPFQAIALEFIHSTIFWRPKVKQTSNASRLKAMLGVELPIV
jgi:hypothetical protein